MRYQVKVGDHDVFAVITEWEKPYNGTRGHIDDWEESEPGGIYAIRLEQEDGSEAVDAFHLAEACDLWDDITDQIEDQVAADSVH